jgi:hypothetical protein
MSEWELEEDISKEILHAEIWLSTEFLFSNQTVYASTV